MTAESPDLLDLLREQNLRPGDPGPEVRAIVDAMNGDLIHRDDRIRIVASILNDGLAHGGIVDPNRVRKSLTDEHGNLTVYPRLVGAIYGGLSRSGHLKFHSWVESDDLAGGNRGKPARRYTLTTVRGAFADRASA